MVILQLDDISNQSTFKGEKMRRKYNPQMSLFSTPSSKPIAKELEQISLILDENRKLVERLCMKISSGQEELIQVVKE